jgi:hypothetical protein
MGHRYLKGLIDEVELDGETVRVAADSSGGQVGVGTKADISLKALDPSAPVPAVALFKQSKRDASLPSGWTVLSKDQYEAEFQALKGRAPAPGEY